MWNGGSSAWSERRGCCQFLGRSVSVDRKKQQ
jgi:hypothetical protein